MYDQLFKAWQKEQASRAISPLDDTFWESIRSYVKTLEDRLNRIDPSNILGPILKQELRNSRYMVHDIFQLRLQKLLEAVPKPEPQTGLISIEQQAMQQIKQSIGALDNSVDAIEKGDSEESPPHRRALTEPDSPLPPPPRDDRSPSSGKPVDASSQVPKYLLVRFLAHLQPITGLDLRPYGPFQPEDVATLPVELARPLIHQNIAIEQRKDRS